MGHEFTGTVVEAGSDVHTVRAGDKVVTPFTASWYVLRKCVDLEACYPEAGSI
jgi:threonine dehydrogenase-like Zn-dependent dehydrogenase